jgi:F-type H+-transporting ATPase subunit epsilon
MTLRVELVVPEGELWSGSAELVIAKTLDGDIGVLTGHTPVLGILAAGSVVTIRPEDGAADGDRVMAAVGGGFLAVADNRVSILAHEAQLGREVNVPVARAALDKALQELEATPGGGEEPAEVRYLRAQLRAAGEPDAKA